LHPSSVQPMWILLFRYTLAFLGARNFSQRIAINKSFYSRVRVCTRNTHHVVARTRIQNRERDPWARNTSANYDVGRSLYPKKRDRCVISCREPWRISFDHMRIMNDSQKITPIKDTHVSLKCARIYLVSFIHLI